MHSLSFSEFEILDELANELDTLHHDVNLLMEARNEIGTEVGLRFKRAAGRLSRVKSRMDTVPGKIQTSDIWSRSQKTDATKASCLSKKSLLMRH